MKKRNMNKLYARIASVVGVLVVGVLTQRKWIDPMAAVTASSMIGTFLGSTMQERFKNPETLGEPEDNTVKIKP